jgi:tetratricopeptide (TPR) repeat protein
MKMAFAIALLLAPALSLADSAADARKDRARELYKQAQIHHRTGDLEKAASEFKESYELYPVPETLYNLAQTHRLLKNYEKAVFFYKQYLATADAKPADKKMIQDRIAEMEQLLEQQRHALNAPPVGVEPPSAKPVQLPASTPSTAPTTALERQNVAVTASAPAPAPAKKPVYKTWWLWTIVGSAAVGIGLGVGLGLSRSAPASNSFPGVTL